MSTVTADSIRINDSDAGGGGWSNYNAGGGGPASEPQRKYQGTGVVGRKANSSNSRTGVLYTGAATNTTLPANALVLLKGTVDDNADLNQTFGLEFAIGSAQNQHAEYNVAGSGSPNDWHKVYNSVGGEAAAYIFAAIDPSITQWRDSTVGAPNLASVAFFALGAQFVDGAAKNENVGLDAIDIGTGLSYSGGAFSFQDGVDADQGIVNNRWGWAAAVGKAIFLRGLHKVNATGTDTSIVFFPDGMHSTGLAGIEAQATTEFAGSYSGLGRDYGFTDTRPDFTATGSPTLSGSFTNYRLVALNATSIVTGLVEAASITQGGGSLDGATIRSLALAGDATMVAPDLTLMTGVQFVQVGSGHAIEITAPGNYNIDQLRFSGYGADGATDAAIYNNSGGLVVLERLDASTPEPTVRNGAGATTDIPAVQSTFTVQGVPAGAEIRVYDDEIGDGNNLGAELAGTESHVGGDFVYTHSNPSNQIIVQVIHVGFLEVNQPSSTGIGNQSISIILEPEGNL